MVESVPRPCPSVEQLPLDQIYTSPHQMRKDFDPIALRDLARSMKQEGLIQPITVRKMGAAFELVVGERRLRAAQILGWKTIESRIIEITDEDAAVKGLIENLQRANLSPIEEARGYKQLVEPPYSLTQDAIALRVGKGQTVVARTLALLDLPEEVQNLMPRGIITETHTRSLRKVTDRADQIQLAIKADKEQWSARETEARVKDYLKEMGHPVKLRESKSKSSSEDPLARIWQPILETADEMGVRVSAVRYEGSGKWMLRVEAKGAVDQRRALADFFIRLGQTIHGPLPSDLIDSIQ
jgi:ParB family chromosome partitioning protein